MSHPGTDELLEVNLKLHQDLYNYFWMKFSYSDYFTI